ncbi:Os11g0201441, partial [Oryza sativa Japonica Group]
RRAVRVLSALPAHEVVRTSVLSRRWRDVWRSAPVVRVTAAAGGGGGGWDTATEFNVFLDGLLRLRGRRGGDDGARLEWFVLDLGFPAPGTSPAPSTSSTSAARSASASAPSKNGCCWYYYYLTGLSSPGISRHWS